MKFIDPHHSQWHTVGGEDGPMSHPPIKAHSLLTLGQWHAVRVQWPTKDADSYKAVGVIVPNDVDIEILQADVPKLSLVVLQFPKWVDGRAYTQAHILRRRYRFGGEIRATGEVLVDMMPLLARTGFDAVALRGDQDRAVAERALGFFAARGHYQGDVRVSQPLFSDAQLEPLKGHPMSESSSLIGAAAPPGSAIGLYARASADFETKLAATVDMLKAAAQAHPGHIVQATSLGVEDMVVTDLIARHGLGIAIGTLETGMLHTETSALIPTIESHYATQGLKVEVYRPVQETAVAFVQKNGAKAMYDSLELRKACCGFRKIEPLSRMLADRSAWITGLRREQSSNRGDMLARQEDDQGRAKFNPMIDWTWGDVWHYVSVNQVPYNPLHDQFMPSIGCAPCTRAIAVGEDFRAGRWWWEDEKAKECGLHVHQQAGEELPPLVSQTGPLNESQKLKNEPRS